MATYLEHEDRIVTCPIDNAHRMLASTLQAHLTKCKEDHPDVVVKVCPFNATHLISEGLLDHHLMNCNDRLTLDKQLSGRFEKANAYSGNMVVPSYARDDSYADDESWDNEISSVGSAGYNPKAAMQNNSMLMDLGMTKPAERKKIYRQLHSMDRGMDSDLLKAEAPSSSDAGETDPPQPKAAISSEPLAKSLQAISISKGDTRIAANIFGENANNNSPLRQPPSYLEMVINARAGSSAQGSAGNSGGEGSVSALGRGRGIRTVPEHYESDFPALGATTGRK